MPTTEKSVAARPILPGDAFTCRKVIDSWQHKGTNRDIYLQYASKTGYLWTRLAVAK